MARHRQIYRFEFGIEGHAPEGGKSTEMKAITAAIKLSTEYGVPYFVQDKRNLDKGKIVATEDGYLTPSQPRLES